ncbi:MAG: Ig-like domain repeat protein [Nitrospirota bacterium]
MGDQFGVGTQQNLLSGGDGAKSNGWNLLNSANASTVDIDISNAGYLTITAASGAGDVYYSPLTAVFVYQNITGDFDISTLFVFSAWTGQPGLWCRNSDNSSGENAIGLQLNNSDAIYWKSLVNGTTTQGTTAGTNPHLRINRTGNVFTLYTSTDGSSWTQVTQQTRNDLSSTIQVGLTCSYGAGNHTSKFDYFQGTNSGGGSATTTALSSDTNPAAAGVNVTFTATVTGSSPTGTVTFKDGAVTLGTGNLNGSYQATYSTSSLSAGTHSITAVYGGDSNNAGSTSSALNEVIQSTAGTITLPHLITSGALTQSGNFCNNALPMIKLNADFAAVADAALDLSVLTIDGSVVSTNVSYGLLYGLSMFSNGGVVVGTQGAGKAVFPAFTVKSQTAAKGTLELPCFQTDIEYLTGRIADTRPLKLPRFQIDTLVYNLPIIHGSAGFPVVKVSAGVLTGGGCQCDVTLTAIKMPSLPYVNAYAGGVCAAAAAMKAFIVSTSGYGEYKGNASVAVPVFVIDSLMSFSESARTQVIVLNINTGALTEYTSYEFNGFCQWGAEYFAEGDNGIYILGADTDDGVPISCSIKTSKTELKDPKGKNEESAVKRVPAVNAVVRTPSPFVFKAITDDGAENIYLPEFKEAARSERTAPRRIKLGKGMRGRYWQFAIENTAGAPIEIESFEPEVTALSRKV